MEEDNIFRAAADAIGEEGPDPEEQPHEANDDEPAALRHQIAGNRLHPGQLLDQDTKTCGHGLGPACTGHAEIVVMAVAAEWLSLTCI